MQNVLYCECLLANCEDRILKEKVVSDSEKKVVFWNNLMRVKSQCGDTKVIDDDIQLTKLCMAK